MVLLLKDSRSLAWQGGIPALFLALLLHVTPAFTQPLEAVAQPRLPAGGHTIYLTYLKVPVADQPPDEPLDQALDEPPRLLLSAGAGNVPAVVDTGSTGVVVSASWLPILPPDRQPGQITYSSSGRVMSGYWVHVPVTLTGGNGVTLITEPQPVLAVTRISCLEHARDCTPSDRPAHVAMVGIGFARQDHAAVAGQGQGNPLLNLAPGILDGARRGYVITREGLTVGLNEAATDGFSFVRLAPDPAVPGKWSAASMCMHVDRRSEELCGSLLVDTGVRTMFVSAPSLPAGPTLPLGTQLSVTFVNGPPPPAFRYTVIVGDETPFTAPESVIVTHAHPVPFVNTGLRFLNGFDLLYDADDGYAGYRLHPLVRNSQSPQ